MNYFSAGQCRWISSAAVARLLLLLPLPLLLCLRSILTRRSGHGGNPHGFHHRNKRFDQISVHPNRECWYILLVFFLFCYVFINFVLLIIFRSRIHLYFSLSGIINTKYLFRIQRRITEYSFLVLALQQQESCPRVRRPE